MQVASRTDSQTVSLQAGRTRFILAALLIFPTTIFSVIMICLLLSEGAGGPDFPKLFTGVPLVGVLIWLCYADVGKMIWPPKLDLSLAGLRYAQRGRTETYNWAELDGPTETSGAGGVPLLQMIVKASGKRLLIPPSHFRSTYAEMAGIVGDAQAGRLTSVEGWRSQHGNPSHRELLIRLLIGLGAVALGVWLAKHNIRR